MAGKSFIFTIYKSAIVDVSYALDSLSSLKNNNIFTREPGWDIIIYTGHTMRRKCSALLTNGLWKTPMCKITLPLWPAMLAVYVDAGSLFQYLGLLCFFFFEFLRGYNTIFDRGIKQTHFNRKFNSPWRSICLDSAPKMWITCSWTRQ